VAITNHGHEHVVAIGEDVGDHLHRFAGCPLDRKPALIDARAYVVDDDTTNEGGGWICSRESRVESRWSKFATVDFRLATLDS
jgi:hypothetical protein